MRERNLAFDYLRALAIILVAVLHAWSMLEMDTPQYGWSCYLYRAIVDAGVPLFVLISGALILSEPIVSLSVFFRKRLSRVLIPFVIWATVVYVISVVTNQYPQIHTWQDALRSFPSFLVENKINISHWFVHMIVALYLLTPVLQRVVQLKEGKRICEYMLVTILVGLLLKWLNPSIFILRYCSPLIGYIGLYIAGYYVAQYGVKIPNVIWVFGAGAVILYAVNVWSKCPNNLLTQLTAVAIFGTLSSLTISNKKTPITTAIVSVSRYSYLIYLVHIPLIAAIYLLWNPTPMYLIPLLVGVSVVLICAIGGAILDYLPPTWKGYLGISK